MSDSFSFLSSYSSLGTLLIYMAIQVFIYGGVGPLHSDVTSSGVAKAFGVRLVRCLISSDFLNPKLLISCKIC